LRATSPAAGNAKATGDCDAWNWGPQAEIGCNGGCCAFRGKSLWDSPPADQALNSRAL
jgi:hypothetical protein